MENVGIKGLSAAEQKAVTGLKKSVLNVADKLSIVRESSRDLAPKVMRLFNELAAKYENLGGFVGFARLFDPSMPLHGADKAGGEGYRKNKTYYALDYMRRLQNVRPRGQQGKRDPATDQLARTIATVLQIIKNPDPIWHALQMEFRFNARMLARVRARVENAKPLIDLKAIKPVTVAEAQIVHVEPTTATVEEPAATAKKLKQTLSKAA